MKNVMKTMCLMSLLLVGACSNYVSDSTPNKVTTVNIPDDPLPNNPPNPEGLGPAPVDLTSNGIFDENDLQACGNYTVLSKAGISNVTGSLIVGDMGVSPIAASAITGFSLIADPSNAFSTSSSVTGKVYASNYAVPTPENLTAAIGCIERSYTDATGRTDPDFNELLSGNIGGLTLVPGLYTWTTNITIPTNVTIAGTANDVWIFQTTGDLLQSSATTIILSGGALAKNIFWQVSGQVTVGASAHFEGIILGKTGVNFQTSASMNGRIMAQTMVTFDDNAITEPAD